MTREHAARLDASDPLAAFRNRFLIADPELCYLDGNSLGRVPLATVERLRRVVDDEWGARLVGSWDDWIDLPERVGDAIAPLIGAAPGTVVVADSTTVNLHALVDAACGLRRDRRAIVVPSGEFPTDRYVVAGIAAARGMEARIVHSDPIHGPHVDAVAGAVAPGDVAVVVCSLVDFRTGALLDAQDVMTTAREKGAWVCLDLSHAAGSVPVDVAGLDVELAVGCTYKHLCGGPGSPAFLYVRPDLLPQLRRPQWGWFAQRDQFVMGDQFEPEASARRFLAGTPAVLGLAAVEEGVRLVAEAGIDAIRAKSLALSRLALDLIDERLVPAGFELASPREPDRLGAHVAVGYPDDVQAVGLAARAAAVVPDVRPPDRLRLGLSPLQVSFTEVFDGIQRIAEVVTSGAHRAYLGARSRVT